VGELVSYVFESDIRSGMSRALYNWWRKRIMASFIEQRVEDQIHSLHTTYADNHTPADFTLESLRQAMDTLRTAEERVREEVPTPPVPEYTYIELALTAEELDAGVVCVVFSSTNSRVLPLYHHLYTATVPRDRPYRIEGVMRDCDGCMATELGIVQALVSKDGGPFVDSVNMPTHNGVHGASYTMLSPLLFPANTNSTTNAIIIKNPMKGSITLCHNQTPTPIFTPEPTPMLTSVLSPLQSRSCPHVGQNLSC